MRIHFAIPVEDLQVSREFYESLGLTYVGDWQKPDQELEAVVLENQAGTRIELVYHPTNEDIALPRIAEVLHVGFSVTNIEPLLAGKDILKPITKGVDLTPLI